MRYLVVVLLSLALAAPTLAQSPAGRTKLVGLTLDHWRGSAGPALLRPTLRLTTYPERGPGADLALVFFPDAFSLHPLLLTVGPQAGLALPVRAGPVTRLLKGGAAGIASAGLLFEGGHFRLIPGAQAGLGLLLPVDSKSTVRLDVTRHVYQSSGFRLGVWSFGFGFAGGGPRVR